jgi:hypothetical protein
VIDIGMDIMGLGMDPERDFDGAMERKRVGIGDSVLAPDPVMTDRCRGIDSVVVSEEMGTAIGEDARGLAPATQSPNVLPKTMKSM